MAASPEGQLIGGTALLVFKSNGDALDVRGIIKCPSLALNGGVHPIPKVSANRAVILSGQKIGTTVGAFSPQLRLLSVEVAA